MKLLLSIIILLAASAAPAPAEEVLRLSQVIQTALRDNLEIRAAREKWKAARSRISQEATPEKPTVTFERMYTPKNEDVVSDAVEKSVAVSQEIPFPTTLYLKGRVARKEAQMAEAAYRTKEREVLSRVKSAYAMFFLSHHHTALFEESVALMKQFVKAEGARYASGNSAQLPLLKAGIELTKMENMLVTMKQEKEISRGMLNVLLNRPPQQELPMPEEPRPENLVRSLEELQSLALKERPELKEAEFALAREKAGTWLARSEFLPDIMLTYRRRRMPEGDTHDAMLGLSVPLWLWKEKARINEAAAEREAARAEAASMKNMTLYEVNDRLVKLQTSQRFVELFRTSVLPQVRQMRRVTEAGYRSGSAEFRDLVEATRVSLDFHLEYYEHLANTEIALAELERVVGVDLKSKYEEAQP